MPAERDHAIVLRLTEYSETSQIVTLLTAERGLVRLIAKGARRSTSKRFAAGLDLLELGDVAYVPPRGDAQLGTQTEWVQRDGFLALRRELARLYAGLYAGEATVALCEENDPHPTLYAALHEHLDALCGDAAAARCIAVFQHELLTAVGFLPNLTQCMGCHRPRPAGSAAYFCSTAGGVVCRDCEMNFAEKRRLRAALLDSTP